MPSIESIPPPGGGESGGWRGKTVLVTGASGTIGSQVVAFLAARGADVRAMVLPGDRDGRLDAMRCRRTECDLRDAARLPKAVAGVPVVFHCAANVGGNGQEALNRVNVDGTRRLVDACLETGAGRERFLYVSSIAAMGPSEKNGLLNEDSPCRPVSPYGQSKLEAEDVVRSQSGNLPSTIIRLPVIYGPGSMGGLTIVFKMVRRGVVLKPGEMESTICFIWDAVRGLLGAALSPATAGRTYILGEGWPWTFDGISRVIAGHMGVKPITLSLPPALLEKVTAGVEIANRLSGRQSALSSEAFVQYVRHRYWRCDTSRASREFGFRPRYPLALGARIALRWYRRQGCL